MKSLHTLFSIGGYIISAAVALAAPMTNADVIKMVEGKLDDAIIIAAVQNAEAKFDTSADGLITLSTAKVPADVIGAMIKRTSVAVVPPAAAQGTEAAASAEDAISPSEVLLIDGDTRTPMRYLTPQTRTAARGMGYGGVATYSVLRGEKAATRIKSGKPSFLVSVPNQAQTESYVTIASFAVRKNQTREVMTGGGGGFNASYSTGIHPDRIINCDSEKAVDQSKAQKGFTIYKLTPKVNMKPGEYAVILYTGEMHGMVSAWFASVSNSYFDFGLDH